MALAKQHITKIIERIPITIKGMLENSQAFYGVAGCGGTRRGELFPVGVGRDVSENKCG
jgi:hypothetical protein